VTDDDELRARLRAVDPASSLPPADPARVARLLEDTMSRPTDSDVLTESAESGTRRRSPLTWLAAAAAVVVISGVGAYALLQGGADTSPGPGAVVRQATVTQLTAPPAVAAKCMVPNARILAGQTLAFDGTVESIADGVVTLVPTHFYTGEETDRVTVEAPSADLQALIGAVQFEEGGRYLVSATDGNLTVCGFSGPYTDNLAALYAEAFPG
jgi:hypothetical protein